MPQAPRDFNYIAGFLTFACRYDCWFCINRNSELARRRPMSGDVWIDFINSLERDVPFTLQGGEPTCHPDFYRIVNETTGPIDLLTNLSFDADEFIDRAAPKRFYRHAPFAPIRSTFYRDRVSFEEYAGKCVRLIEAGFDLFVFTIRMPDDDPAELEDYQRRFRDKGIEFRVKPFLGLHEGRLYPEGGYLYDEAVTRRGTKRCQCRTTEILIAPDGHMFRCHADLYENVGPIAHIEDPAEALRFRHRPCDRFGLCNPCDLKIKNNRMEQGGFCAVDIRDVEDMSETATDATAAARPVEASVS